MTIFIMGSALRYDRDQYTWKADSSQLLRKKACCGVVTCSMSGLFYYSLVILLVY